jgi:hypothetical protein
MLHSNVLTILSDLSAPAVPTCAIKLIKSYLTGRSMCVRYKGAESTFHRVPGGGPQGGLLTGLLFCLQVNRAGRPCPDTSARLPALGSVQPAEPPCVVRPLCHNSENMNKEAYIDDLTLLEKISLSSLVDKPRIIGPPPYHGRFHLALPLEQSILQHQLTDLQEYTRLNSMVINKKKTKCLPFNNSLSKDFMPELSLDGSELLEVIYQLKLVGLVITSDLSWDAHVNYTVGRVNGILWQLVRLRQLGASREKLLEFYVVKIRSILMFGAVCFHSSLPAHLSRRLELQQRRALVTVLGTDFMSYRRALLVTGLPRLDILREDACLKWAVKAQANPQHAALFPINESTVDTRHRRPFSEYNCSGAKFFRSAVPSMVRALNASGAQPAGTSGKEQITTNSGIVINL